MTAPSKPKYFAIVSDIHGNIDALEAVLADIEKWPCSDILCLGDVVGYGPAPALCVEKVIEVCAVTLMGNHEAMLFLVDKLPSHAFRETISKPLRLALKELPANRLRWLRQLPMAANIDPFTLSHGSLHEPSEFHYLHDEDMARDHFSVQPTQISFQGHTHVPVIWEKKKNTIACYDASEGLMQVEGANLHAINVGSVGQPRDEDPRACYVLYDVKKRMLIHRRVKYDIARAQARFKKAGMPSDNLVRIGLGY
jgi:diadenosine tetraphosphatase ApaH/serine/threonine PP2A family protein phosphatase